MKKILLACALILLLPLFALANIFNSFPISYQDQYQLQTQPSSVPYWDDTATIQAFINAGGGTYPFGNYIVTSLTFNHSFNGSNCTITTTNTSGVAFLMSTAGVTVSNTNFIGTGSGSPNAGSGIHISQPNCTITGSSITGFEQYGIIVDSDSNTIITNSTIRNIGYLGVSIITSGSTTTTNIQFTNNTIDRSMNDPTFSTMQPAIIIRALAPSVFTNATMTGNIIKMPVSPVSAAAEGVEIQNVSSSTISNNTFTNGTIGISAVGTGSMNNLIANNNTFTGQSAYGVEIGDANNCRFSNSTITSGKVGVIFDAGTSGVNDTVSSFHISGVTSFPIQFRTTKASGSVLQSDTLTTVVQGVYIGGASGITITNMGITGNSTSYPIYLDTSPGGVSVTNSSFTGFAQKIFAFYNGGTASITVNNVTTVNVTISPGTSCYTNLTPTKLTVGPNVSCTTVNPPNISYSPNSYTFTKNAPIGTISVTNSGGSSTTYTIDSPQPSGITFNTSTGQFAGTPTVLSTTHTYHVTATNIGGSSTTPITFTVVDVAPTISYSPNSQVIVINTAMTNMTPISTGGAVVNYTISPALPTGLNFNTSTGVISGTPTVLSSATSYTVTGFNTGGSSPTTVTLTVNPPAPSISYSPNTNSYPINTPITAWTPTNTGGAATAWGVSPTLPTGLSLNTSTGVITGTPTVLQGATNYTVTATNVTGSSPTTITISVINATPPAPIPLYTPNTYTFYLNTGITPITPTNSGGTAVTWSINTPLPTGLNFNTSTGVISGTPTALSSPVTYTVTATNTGGSNSTPITIGVQAQAPNISYSPASRNFPANVAISAWSPTNTGGTATSWGISPGLPTGLNFDTSTGIITGTPTVAQVSTPYVVTATNATGSSNFTIHITITVAIPIITYSPSTVTITINVLGPTLSPMNTGGVATSWGITPTLPTGLNFNTSTGVITGTPTVLSAATSYTVSATNAGGTGTTHITISVIKRTRRILSFPGKVAKYP